MYGVQAIVSKKIFSSPSHYLLWNFCWPHLYVNSWHAFTMTHSARDSWLSEGISWQVKTKTEEIPGCTTNPKRRACAERQLEGRSNDRETRKTGGRPQSKDPRPEMKTSLNQYSETLIVTVLLRLHVLCVYQRLI